MVGVESQGKAASLARLRNLSTRLAHNSRGFEDVAQ